MFHMFYQRATNRAQLSRGHWLPVLVMLAVVLGLTGCAGNAAHTRSASAESAGVQTNSGNRGGGSPALRAASIAEQQVGIPYRYGGSDRQGFDCSGLVYYSYANAGTQVARTTGGLWGTLQPVAKNKLQTGDVLFFDIEGKMSHVGLYLGQGRFVHAPSTGRSVVVGELNSEFYRHALIRGGRTD